MNKKYKKLIIAWISLSIVFIPTIAILIKTSVDKISVNTNIKKRNNESYFLPSKDVLSPLPNFNNTLAKSFSTNLVTAINKDSNIDGGAGTCNLFVKFNGKNVNMSTVRTSNSEERTLTNNPKSYSAQSDTGTGFFIEKYNYSGVLEEGWYNNGLNQINTAYDIKNIISNTNTSKIMADGIGVKTEIASLELVHAVSIGISTFSTIPNPNVNPFTLWSRITAAELQNENELPSLINVASKTFERNFGAIDGSGITLEYYPESGVDSLFYTFAKDPSNGTDDIYSGTTSDIKLISDDKNYNIMASQYSDFVKDKKITLSVKEGYPGLLSDDSTLKFTPNDDLGVVSVEYTPKTILDKGRVVKYNGPPINLELKGFLTIDKTNTSMITVISVLAVIVFIILLITIILLILIYKFKNSSNFTEPKY